jgi:hypothetical protein
MRGPTRTEVNLMQPTLRSSASSAPGGLRGTFYPDEESGAERSIGSGLAKLAVVLVALAVVRGVIGHAGRHGGDSRKSRRRQMIAELHRQLHAEGAAPSEPPTTA